jgi:hypothetical protein
MLDLVIVIRGMLRSSSRVDNRLRLTNSCVASQMSRRIAGRGVKCNLAWRRGRVLSYITECWDLFRVYSIARIFKDHLRFQSKRIATR